MRALEGSVSEFAREAARVGAPGEILRLWRERAGMGRTELAKLAEVTLSELERLEGLRECVSPEDVEAFVPVYRAIQARVNVPRDTTLGSPPSLAQLRARREEIWTLARAWGALSLTVVGSVARGEEGPGSDLDVLVRMPADSYLERGYLHRGLQDLLSCRVDLINAHALEPETILMGRPALAERARLRAALEADAMAI